MAESIGRVSTVRSWAPVALPTALAAVVGFWWAATGVTIAMQRDAATRVTSLVVASLLAALGAALIARTRDVRTPGAACRSFAGGALLWAWVSALFYGGWVTGAAAGPPVAAAAGPSLTLAAQAMAATLHADLLSLAVLALAALLTRGAPNRVGLWTLVLFWGAHQTAKLNVFFGVRHPGSEFLPPHLAHLTRFFGPPHNSLLLPATVLALGALTAVLVVRARRAPTRFGRTANALLAALAALALLEHALLGVDVSPPLWDVFLRARAA